MNPKSLYICSFCGKSTYDVDTDYLVGYNHLACALLDDPKPLKIINWEKLTGTTFLVMGIHMIIKDARLVDETKNSANYSAYIFMKDAQKEPLVRVDFFSFDMELSLKLYPPININTTPFNVYKTITKDHIKNPSIFVSTISEMMISDASVRNILVNLVNSK